MIVDPGRLRHRVAIETPARSRDVYGQKTPDYVHLATVYASVRPLKGDKRFTMQQVVPEVSVSVLIRYRAGVTPECRLVHRGRFLLPRLVLNDREANEWLELICEERADGIHD